METLEKQTIQELAESKGLVAVRVRINSCHIYFIKRDGRVLHDDAFDFEEALCFLNNYMSGAFPH